MQDRPLRVLYFGTYRAEYSRNQIMIAGLRCAGAEVIECQEQLWHSIEDRVQTASGGWKRPGFWLRVVRAYLRLLRRYRQAGPYDVMVTGYPGQFDVFLARLLSWWRGKPLVWDIFMSIYLIALERGLEQRSRWTIEAIRRLERLACSLPDRLILDTTEYVSWFAATHNVKPERFRLVPTGADDRTYRPLPNQPDGLGPFRVLYYGTFIPNHGVPHIIEAARLLANESSIQFELIGEGPDREAAQARVKEAGLTHVQFTGWMDKSELVQRVANAHVCLGAFGTTPQSVMTVQNKIYEGLAMARPVITGDSPAVRQTLEHGRHIYLCERANPSSLAQAILDLYHDPELRQKLSEEGSRLFFEQYDLAHNGQRFREHLQTVANSKREAKPEAEHGAEHDAEHEAERR